MLTVSSLEVTQPLDSCDDATSHDLERGVHNIDWTKSYCGSSSHTLYVTAWWQFIVVYHSGRQMAPAMINHNELPSLRP